MSDNRQVVYNTIVDPMSAVDAHIQQSLYHYQLKQASPAPLAQQPRPGSGCSGDSWRQKNLPPSFFDITGAAKDDSNVSLQSNGSSGVSSLSPPNISHSRTHSSPATLMPSLSLVAGKSPLASQHNATDTHQSQRQGLPPVHPGAPAISHGRSHSYDTDLFLGGGTAGHMTLPESQNQNTPMLTGRSNSAGALSCAATATSGPLPAGWELSYTSNGCPFYIDHNSQTTSWFDPRIPEDIQRPRIAARHGQFCVPGGSNPMSPQGASGESSAVGQNNFRSRSGDLRRQGLMNSCNSSPVSGLSPQPMQGYGASEAGHARQESADSGVNLQHKRNMGRNCDYVLSQELDARLNGIDLGPDNLTPSIGTDDLSMDSYMDIIQS